MKKLPAKELLLKLLKENNLELEITMTNTDKPLPWWTPAVTVKYKNE